MARVPCCWTTMSRAVAGHGIQRSGPYAGKADPWDYCNLFLHPAEKKRRSSVNWLAVNPVQLSALQPILSRITTNDDWRIRCSSQFIQVDVTDDASLFLRRVRPQLQCGGIRSKKVGTKLCVRHFCHQDIRRCARYDGRRIAAKWETNLNIFANDDYLTRFTLDTLQSWMRLHYQ